MVSSSPSPSKARRDLLHSSPMKSHRSPSKMTPSPQCLRASNIVRRVLKGKRKVAAAKRLITTVPEEPREDDASVTIPPTPTSKKQRLSSSQPLSNSAVFQVSPTKFRATSSRYRAHNHMSSSQPCSSTSNPDVMSPSPRKPAGRLFTAASPSRAIRITPRKRAPGTAAVVDFSSLCISPQKLASISSPSARNDLSRRLVPLRCFPINFNLCFYVRFKSSSPLLPWQDSPVPSAEIKARASSMLTTSPSALDPVRCKTDPSYSRAWLRRHCAYYVFPHLGGRSLLPAKRNRRLAASPSSSPAPKRLDESELSLIKEQWQDAFIEVSTAVQLGTCPYLYLCAHTCSILFVAGDVDDSNVPRAVILPSTPGLRQSLKKHDIEFSLPALNKGLRETAQPSTLRRTQSSALLHSTVPMEQAASCFMDPSASSQQERALEGEQENGYESHEEASPTKWLNEMGISPSVQSRLQTCMRRSRVGGLQDASFDETALLVENAVNVQRLSSYIIGNLRLLDALTGPQAHVPPRILSPVPFAHCRLEYVNPKFSGHPGNYTLELNKAPIMPHTLFAFSRILDETAASDISIRAVESTEFARVLPQRSSTEVVTADLNDVQSWLCEAPSTATTHLQYNANDKSFSLFQ